MTARLRTASGGRTDRALSGQSAVMAGLGPAIHALPRDGRPQDANLRATPGDDVDHAARSLPGHPHVAIRPLSAKVEDCPR